VDRVVLARHGESERSIEGLTNGDPRVACPLTAVGREEARRLGVELADDPISLCVTSEFERARETADLALEGRRVQRLVLAELNDIRFGEFEGLPLTDYRAWAHTHGPEDAVPGGESRAGTVARYVRAYRTILARPEETILVVAHGLPVRYVLDAVEGRDPAAAVAQVPYAEPFRLTVAELAAAVGRLEAWVAAPAWFTGVTTTPQSHT
jgi:broad specificity phosphatase PhoE